MIFSATSRDISLCEGVLHNLSARDHEDVFYRWWTDWRSASDQASYLSVPSFVSAHFFKAQFFRFVRSYTVFWDLWFLLLKWLVLQMVLTWYIFYTTFKSSFAKFYIVRYFELLKPYWHSRSIAIPKFPNLWFWPTMFPNFPYEWSSLLQSHCYSSQNYVTQAFFIWKLCRDCVLFLRVSEKTWLQLVIVT